MKATARKLGTNVPESSDEPEDTWMEIWRGLNERPRRLPCKLFYDARGSELFERITEQPEYYPTRAELEILRERAPEIAARVGPEAVLIEFGSGASIKTRLLLDALERPSVYVPIDISISALKSSADALRELYPELDVRPLEADYTRDLELPLTAAEQRRNGLAFFPGSTIGNFERADALAFLRRARHLCGAHRGFSIGVDLPKNRAVLEAAYDDAAGVTRAFNQNILHVLNRRYGADFNPGAFAHRAIWNAEAGRVEMHLTSRERQCVRLGSRVLEIERDEPIITEHCYKYAPEEFGQLAKAAGFALSDVWLDREARFSVLWLTPEQSGADRPAPPESG